MSSKLIVDLSNQNGKLVDNCGNTWKYYGSSTTDIPSDCIVRYKNKSNVYGFRTDSNSRFVEMTNFSTEWNSASTTMTNWTISVRFLYDSALYYNAWCAVVPNVNVGVPNADGSRSPQKLDGKLTMFAIGINGSNSQFEMYHSNDNNRYSSIAVTNVNTNVYMKAVADKRWKYITFIFDGSKIKIYNNITHCANISPSNVNYPYLKRQLPIRLGGWPNIYATQTAVQPFYTFKVWEGIQYPDPEYDEEDLFVY